MPKILITGAKGMLAADLIAEFERAGAELVLTDINADLPVSGRELIPLDITNAKEVFDLVSSLKPNYILNCAAYTAVDKAEEEGEQAFRVNTLGPANLAQAARLNPDCCLAHVSSDYVFGGGQSSEKEKRVPYLETGPYHACGIYGQSKRMGDEFLTRLAPLQTLIIRPSWLHGINGPNFVDTMLKVGREKAELGQPLKVVDDQVGSPTWTVWLASVIRKLIEKDARGVFHASSRGNISWHEFAKEIFLQARIKVDLRTQTTAELGRKAPRPAYSTLDVSKLENFLGERAISWQESVSSHLKLRGVI